jgi:biotin carboxyl carrier protein
MKRLDIEVDGKVINVLYTQVAGKTWYHIDGETFVSEVKTKSTQRKKAGEASGNNVHSPMPGKVTKILVQEKSAVEHKQTLIVLEAMKMEYNLKAGVGGRVKAIHCKVGDQVDQDRLLLEIEPA